MPNDFWVDRHYPLKMVEDAPLTFFYCPFASLGCKNPSFTLLKPHQSRMVLLQYGVVKALHFLLALS